MLFLGQINFDILGQNQFRHLRIILGQINFDTFHIDWVELKDFRLLPMFHAYFVEFNADLFSLVRFESEMCIAHGIVDDHIHHWSTKTTMYTGRIRQWSKCLRQSHPFYIANANFQLQIFPIQRATSTAKKKSTFENVDHTAATSLQAVQWWKKILLELWLLVVALCHR